jgi:hypothetical protein
MRLIKYDVGHSAQAGLRGRCTMLMGLLPRSSKKDVRRAAADGQAEVDS